MGFETEEELKNFIFNTGCFDKIENEKIYERFFRGSIERNKRLRYFVDLEAKNVLDVGCSYGNWLIHFPQDSMGVEIQPKMIQFARSLGLKVISANVEDVIPIESSSFDIVHCRDVLEHFVAPHKVLREIYRVLRDNGKVVIGVPNMDSPLLKGWKATSHLYSYNKKSLSFLLERSGFRVIRAFVMGRRLPNVLSFLIYEKLLPGRAFNLNVVAHKEPDFKYHSKKLDIFTPSWMK
ncbi:MAG: class I SAM-dependent methyltransferase [Dehalococcoidales bacterium]